MTPVSKAENVFISITFDAKICIYSEMPRLRLFYDMILISDIVWKIFEKPSLYAFKFAYYNIVSDKLKIPAILSISYLQI